jgi:hypothetical protein
MFADYLPSTNSSIGIRDQICQRSTILSGTRQYTTLIINPTKIGLSQAREEHQPTHGMVRFRGIHTLIDVGCSSIKICKILAAVNHESTRIETVHPAAAFNLRSLRTILCQFVPIRGYGLLITYLTLREGGRFP